VIGSNLDTGTNFSHDEPLRNIRTTASRSLTVLFWIAETGGAHLPEDGLYHTLYRTAVIPVSSAGSYIRRGGRRSRCNSELGDASPFGLLAKATSAFASCS